MSVFKYKKPVELKEPHCGEVLETRYLGDHEDGWHIFGQIQRDYYEWINDFFAYNDNGRFICGDFEYEVVADSEETFNEFKEKYPPYSFDYWDI